MSNLDHVVLQLRKERDEAQKRVEHLDQALAALGSLNGTRALKTRSAHASGRKRRTMSAAARRRIAAAQRARWARWKAARRNKQEGSTPALSFFYVWTLPTYR